MADIEVVIKIPEEAYNILKNNGVDWLGAEHILDRVAKGTQLPKGHGRLVDVGQCNRKLFYKQCGGADSLITVKSAFDMLMSLSTIIEEDKVESEG